MDIYEEKQQAWDKLCTLAGGGVRANQILQPFRAVWETEIQHVKVAEYEKGEPKYYKSTLEDFPSWLFGSEIEANLANALFLMQKSTGKKFDNERFKMVFGLALTLLDVESDWRI